MAEIQSIDIKTGDFFINLKLSKTEYEMLGLSTKDLILLPTKTTKLEETLTTGKLGNSNRIMLPKKILSKYSIGRLVKHVPAKVFKLDDTKFLFIRLEETKKGIPEFEEEYDVNE
jgi:hypothetical protein